MIKLDELIGDLIFVSFSNHERYKDIGIKESTGHFLLKGFDRLGLWLEHPGIVIIHAKDESGTPLPVKKHTRENIDANFVVTWDNVNTIMHYPDREGFDFPSEFKKMKLGFSVDNEKKRDQENDFLFNSGHKLMNKLPDQFSPFKKKIGNIYKNIKTKKVENSILPKLNEIESLKLTNYQKRLLKKSVVYPRDCYDENFRPSLIFYGTNIPKNKIIHNQIGSIDIFPTIFDLIEISIANNIRGKSMLNLLNNESYIERALMLDGASSESESKISNTIGVRTSKFKYFRDRFDNSKNIHLFDIQNDPLEENNIFENNLDIINSMEMELQKINPSNNFSFKKLDQLSNNDEQKAKDILKKLGYI